MHVTFITLADILLDLGSRNLVSFLQCSNAKSAKPSCLASAPSSLVYSITYVYATSALVPMNKFACELHGYIVYFPVNEVAVDPWTNTIAME